MVHAKHRRKVCEVRAVKVAGVEFTKLVDGYMLRLGRVWVDVDAKDLADQIYELVADNATETQANFLFEHRSASYKRLQIVFTKKQATTIWRWMAK